MSLKKIAWLFGVPLVLFAGIVFYLYGHNLGDISHLHEPWSSFGSLLSGVFTLVGAGATVGTLLYLSHQNKEMQKVTQAQLNTLTFERYISHRKLFTDQLNELVTNHKNTFAFRDPSHLYSSIFPMNSPHHCEFSVPPSYDENGNGINHVGLLYRKLERIKSALDLVQPDPDDVDRLVQDLIDLSYDLLMIEPVGDRRVGDVVFRDSVYGFNIFALNEFIEPAVKIANMIFRFTNNPVMDAQLIQGNSYFIKEAFLKTFFPEQNKISLIVFNNITGLSTFVWLYLVAKKMYDGNEPFLPGSVKLLRSKLFSVDVVNELAEKENFDAVLNSCIHELKRKLSGMTHQDEHYTQAMEFDHRLRCLLDHYR
ncbi:hypothetical protein [Pseudomonas ficuserectae]|uniref:hypothetical protein n=1 Tax=Pseudomonas ficuserectae TaxID=53410 RepID=UPI0006D5E14A|nr:hypothetical protein [Pseudomonas ficuserectae]KPX33050.1 hypothetical protein ALO69_200042 [Pseudomonas ficuserectae]RMS31595.1 hypothetical protein ALP68_03349 [Pseudomonas ficuserectae]RMS32303.1 hypothetical protein ALP67_03538 [Pseudomonas ficuserectae]